MYKSYFAKDAPEIEISDCHDYIVIRPIGAGHDVAVSPHTLQKFVFKANQVLADWRAIQAAKVVPFRKGAGAA